MALTWTKTAPTEEGWYWAREWPRHRGPARVRIAYVYRGKNGMGAKYGLRHLLYRECEWAGPIPEPEVTP